MTKKPNKKQLASLLEQARLQVAKGQAREAEELLRGILVELDNPPATVRALLVDALNEQSRFAEAEAVAREGLAAASGEPLLLARLAVALQQQGRLIESVEAFEGAAPALGKEPAFLLRYGSALISAGRPAEAEAHLSAALRGGAGHEARLLLAWARGKLGRYQETRQLAAEVAKRGKRPEVVAAARGLEADARLLLGETGPALEAFKALRAEGLLDPIYLAHTAYAAALQGEPALAAELVAERRTSGTTAEDQLLFAQIENLRGAPESALSHLESAHQSPGDRMPGFAFEVDATRARALRLLGRSDEARQLLEQLVAVPEASTARLGPKVRIDLGHLSAEAGDFERAHEHFAAALALDPKDPEAARGLSLTERRVAWRTELAASTEAKVQAAQAEAEALRRRVMGREGELEALRQELERLKAAKREIEKRAQLAEQQADEAKRAADLSKVREELESREQDANAKAAENVQKALGDNEQRCPLELRSALLVAERTFQRALFTELPASAVAVLFSGALERALWHLFVGRFDRWLDAESRRAQFLAGAVRERRGKRVEYFDHFIEAFDREREGRAPAMGEVLRVLQRRNEPYLEPFRRFLEASYPVSDGYYDQVAQFVAWSKEKLRDPGAHGRGIELGYEELRKFRERLLFDLDGTGRGALVPFFDPPP